MNLRNMMPVDPIEKLGFFRTWAGALAICGMILVGIVIISLLVSILKSKQQTTSEEVVCPKCKSNKLHYGDRQVDPSHYHGFRFINQITCLECGNTFIRS